MNTYIKAAVVSLFALMLCAPPAMAASGNAALPVPPPAPARSKGPKGCQAKESMLRWKLADARERGAAEQALGLERALVNVKAWCTDGSLKAKADLEVWEKEQEAAEREQDLQQARAGGKSDKIAKREMKLAKAKRELEQAPAAPGR